MIKQYPTKTVLEIDDRISGDGHFIAKFQTVVVNKSFKNAFGALKKVVSCIESGRGLN